MFGAVKSYISWSVCLACLGLCTIGALQKLFLQAHNYHDAFIDKVQVPHYIHFVNTSSTLHQIRLCNASRPLPRPRSLRPSRHVTTTCHRGHSNITAALTSMQSVRDKDVEVVDLDRLFEEYIDADLLCPSNDSATGQPNSDELARLFELASSNESELFGTEPILDRETKAAWHKALQDCDQNPASSWPYNSTCAHHVISSIGKDSLSDSELFNFPGVLGIERDQPRSVSQPSTPRPHTSVRPPKKAVSFHSQLQHRGVKKLSKRSSTKSSSQTVQSPHHRFHTAGAWTCRTNTPMDAFTRASSCRIASVSSSWKPSQQENTNATSALEHQHSILRGHSQLPTDAEKGSSHYLSPSSVSPEIQTSHGSCYDQNAQLMFESLNVPDQALSALPTPPSTFPLAMTQWSPEEASALDFGFTATTAFSSDSKACAWWDTGIPATQPSQHTIESDSWNASRGVATQDLGITCDDESFAFGGVNIYGTGPPAPTSFDMATYGAMYPTPPAQYQYHTTSTAHSISRSPSPDTQSRIHRRKPSSHSRHRASHSQRRKFSHSSQRSARQTSSSGGGGNSGVGFVNFTPDDSRKILTGVAPSGSSKTKARREREAADNRRKLSQAAMKAILEAGGDMDSIRQLAREGYLTVEG